MIIDSRHPDAKFIRVFINGIEQKGVIRVNVSESWVEYYKIIRRNIRVFFGKKIADILITRKHEHAHITLVDKRTGTSYLVGKKRTWTWKNMKFQS